MRSARRYPANSASASAMLAAAPLSSACLIRRCNLSAAVKALMMTSQSDVEEGAAPAGRHGVPAFVAEIAVDADLLGPHRRPGEVGQDECDVPRARDHGMLV